MNYIDHSLIAISTVTGCVSISTFASLVSIPIGITISAIGLKSCVKKYKKYKWVIKKKKKKKHDKIVLLAKSQLNRSHNF